MPANGGIRSVSFSKPVCRSEGERERGGKKKKKEEKTVSANVGKG